jgi:NitT/TauT family transport system ATP-binding protein/nitrate/nitrite transport system substrate-binding protein
MTEPVRLGLLRLTDSAPAVLAEAEGLFAAAGLAVSLQIEPSWANVADKLAWGLLDAAIMLPPLVLAMAGGLRGPKVALRVPMGISQGGNSVVVAPKLAAVLAGETGLAPAMAVWVRAQPQPPRFAVVHVFSTHNLLLRHWLAGAGLDPDRDVEIVVVPPERVVAALGSGQVVGFCAGAPWGDVAEAAGAGRVLLGTSQIRPDHAEKCLAVSAAWAAARPDAVAALCGSLRQAQQRCDDAFQSSTLAALLVARLGLPAAGVRAALAGGAGREHVRFAPAAGADSSDGRWFLDQMRRWGWPPEQADGDDLLAKIYSND